MPNLPTFFVTDAQAQRLLAAFGSVENYKDWLREQIINHVINMEQQDDLVSFREAQNAKKEELKQVIPKSNPDPVV